MPVNVLRTPNLAADFHELDRRLRVVEYGDPYDVNSRIADIPAQVKALVDPALDTTYDNDGLVSNYTLNWINAFHNWMTSELGNFVGQVALWYVHQHEWAIHSIGQNPGTPPQSPLWPIYPAQPNLVYPTIVIP